MAFPSEFQIRAYVAACYDDRDVLKAEIRYVKAYGRGDVLEFIEKEEYPVFQIDAEVVVTKRYMKLYLWDDGAKAGHNHYKVHCLWDADKKVLYMPSFQKKDMEV